jgi:hypothetical protein
VNLLGVQLAVGTLIPGGADGTNIVILARLVLAYPMIPSSAEIVAAILCPSCDFEVSVGAA